MFWSSALVILGMTDDRVVEASSLFLDPMKQNLYFLFCCCLVGYLQRIVLSKYPSRFLHGI